MYGQVTDTPGSSVTSARDQTGIDTNLVLYIVFAVSILVFVLVILIVVKLMRRKSPNPNGYTLTSTGKNLSESNVQTPERTDLCSAKIRPQTFSRFVTFDLKNKIG